MADTRNQIISALKHLVLDLKKSHDIREAYLYGSYARNNPTRYSDVDIALVLGTFRDGSPMDERFEIFHEVQQHNSQFEVLCLTEEEFNDGDMPIVRHIKREGIRIL